MVCCTAACVRATCHSGSFRKLYLILGSLHVLGSPIFGNSQFVSYFYNQSSLGASRSRAGRRGFVALNFATSSITSPSPTLIRQCDRPKARRTRLSLTQNPALPCGPPAQCHPQRSKGNLTYSLHSSSVSITKNYIIGS